MNRDKIAQIPRLFLCFLAGTALVILLPAVPSSHGEEEDTVPPTWSAPHEGVILDTAIHWTAKPHWTGRKRYTPCAAAETIPGSTFFQVTKESKAGTWHCGLDIPIDSGRYPILVMQYQAWNLIEKSDDWLIRLRVNKKGRIVEEAIVVHKELVTDWKTDEITKDLRDFKVWGAIEGIAVQLVSPALSDETSCFALTSLAFLSPEKDLEELYADDPVNVKVLDNSGTPLAGAHVSIDHERLNFEQTGTTDPDGLAEVVPFENEYGFHTVRIEDQEGNHPGVTTYPFRSGERDPVVVQLPEGRPQNGVVIDETGRPISCAVVRITTDFKCPIGLNIPPTRSFVTEDDGQWTSPPLPANCRSVDIRINHPDFNTYRLPHDFRFEENDNTLVPEVQEIVLSRRTRSQPTAESPRLLQALLDWGHLYELEQLASAPGESENTRLQVLQAYDRHVNLRGIRQYAEDYFHFWLRMASLSRSEAISELAETRIIHSLRLQGHHVTEMAGILRDACGTYPPDGILAMIEPRIAVFCDTVSALRSDDRSPVPNPMSTTTRAGHQETDPKPRIQPGGPDATRRQSSTSVKIDRDLKAPSSPPSDKGAVRMPITLAASRSSFSHPKPVVLGPTTSVPKRNHPKSRSPVRFPRNSQNELLDMRAKALAIPSSGSPGLQKKRKAVSRILLKQASDRIRKLIVDGDSLQARAKCLELIGQVRPEEEYYSAILQLLAETTPSGSVAGMHDVTSAFLEPFKAQDPHRELALYCAALHCYRKGEPAEAIEQFNALLKQFPDSSRISQVSLIKALCNIRLDHRDVAMQILKEMCNSNAGGPDTAHAQFLIGWMHLVEQEYDKARDALLIVKNKHGKSKYAKKAGAMLDRLPSQ